MHFEQVFWNANFGDYSGFDSVCEYVRTGRHACAAVGEFLKARAQIEETYAKQLLALAKNQAGVKLDGSIGKSWDAVLSNAQNTSACHQKLAEVFNQQSQLTNQLTKTLKQKAKQKEEEVRNYQNDCRSLYEKALKNKSEFGKRSEQRRSLEEEKERLRKETSNGSNSSPSSPTTAKELQKLDVSIKKVISSADTSKQQCSNILEQLDTVKEQWESKTYHALMSYNEMEKNRIIYLRSLFWGLMNAICQTCVDVDKDCDNVRNVILKCDPDTDLEEFIMTRKTGEKRPGPITFDNIGNSAISINAQSQRSFKMAFGKKLGNPWKSSSNGQSNASNSNQMKSPLTPKASPQKLSSPVEKPHAGSDEMMSSSDDFSYSASISPSLSPNSSQGNGNGNGFQRTPPSADQLKQSKVALKPQQAMSGSQQTQYCFVTKTWADNQGSILVQGGTKAKLLEKSSNDLWLIELDDRQTLYCPIEYLQEIL